LEEELEIEEEPRLIEDALLVEPGEAICIFCAASTKSYIDYKGWTNQKRDQLFVETTLQLICI
jgi:hypothetical protein